MSYSSTNNSITWTLSKSTLNTYSSTMSHISSSHAQSSVVDASSIPHVQKVAGDMVTAILAWQSAILAWQSAICGYDFKAYHLVRREYLPAK